MEDTIDLKGNKLLNQTFSLSEEILDILKRLSISSFDGKFCNFVLEKQKDILYQIKNSLNLIHEHPFEEDIEGEKKMLEDKLKNLIDTFICLIDLRSNELNTKELLLRFKRQSPYKRSTRFRDKKYFSFIFRR